ncbi:MAG TPA: SCO family protein [Chthoniobacterales bacterium]
MNATSTADAPKRAPSVRSIAWYVTLILIPVLTAAFLLWLRNAQVQQRMRRTIANYGTAPAFALTNQNGEPFGSAQLQGKVWIADFIFTSCRGPCPLISSRMADMQKPLAKSDVHLVSFTVDPETDTPEVLRDYAHRLQAQPGRWDFLTGPKDTLYELTQKGFKLAVQDEGAETGPDHATRAVLVDRKGTIRGYYDMLAPDTVAKLVADAGKLAREPAK